MSKVFNELVHSIFGINDRKIFFDIRFWLVLICINTGANLGFDYLLPHQTVLSLVFIILLFLTIRSSHLANNQVLFIFLFFFVFFIQATYLEYYSIKTTLHYVMLISVAVMLVNNCKEMFVTYYSGIIFIYAVVSLVCFFYMRFGGTIPFFYITDTNIDDGNILRVYNLFYTQLGDPSNGISFNARNCGPFWEPGAYQGFLNLALWFELTSDKDKDRWWVVRVIVLILTVLTTLSTGGYIVLFFILLFSFTKDKSIAPVFKIVFVVGFLLLSLYFFFSLDFLAEKLIADEARVIFHFSDFPNIMYMLFGYGYSIESFSQSSIMSASSVYNLFRYVGVFGAAVFLMNLLSNKTPHKILFFGLVVLILMNEPFLSLSLIWWGLGFVTYD